MPSPKRVAGLLLIISLGDLCMTESGGSNQTQILLKMAAGISPILAAGDISTPPQLMRIIAPRTMVSPSEFKVDSSPLLMLTQFWFDRFRWPLEFSDSD